MLFKELKSRCTNLLAFLSSALPDHNHLIDVEYEGNIAWIADGKPYTWQIEEITENVIVLIDTAYGLIACIVEIEGIDHYYFSVSKQIILQDYIILDKESYGSQSSIFKRI